MTEQDYFIEKIKQCEDVIQNLNNIISKNKETMSVLTNININTMKKPITYDEPCMIIIKWHNKNKAINQRNKRIRSLDRRIKGYQKQIKRVLKDKRCYEKATWY